MASDELMQPMTPPERQDGPNLIAVPVSVPEVAANVNIKQTDYADLVDNVDYRQQASHVQMPANPAPRSETTNGA